MLGVIAVGTVVLEVLERRGHRRYLRRYARRRGWQWAARNRALVGSFVGAGPFAGRYKIRNVMTFPAGEGSGKAFTVITSVGASRWRAGRYSVIMIDLPTALPFVALQRDAGASRIDLLEDIQFEWHEFNNTWVVHGRDARISHAMINGPMMEWLMQQSAVPRRLSDVFVIDAAVIYTFYKGEMDATTIDRRVDELTAFVERVPPFLWQ